MAVYMSLRLQSILIDVARVPSQIADNFLQSLEVLFARTAHLPAGLLPGERNGSAYSQYIVGEQGSRALGEIFWIFHDRSWYNFIVLF